MELDKKEEQTVQRAIEYWQDQQIIDAAMASRLRESYRLRNNDFSSLSLYAFIAAGSCAMLAFGSLILDEKWIEWLRKYLGISEVFVGIFFLLITLLLTRYGKHRQKKHPRSGAAYEVFWVTVVMSIGVSLAYFGRSFDYFGGNYAPILLVATICYAAFALWTRSHLLWVVALLSLAGWWGAMTYYHAAREHFWGMNYPLRFTVFGLLVLIPAYISRHIKGLRYFFPETHFSGWLFFLSAAWTLSIFGNTGSLEVWSALKQGRLWIWAVAFTIVVVLVILYAVKQKQDALRDLALIFFIINIYTRYFEYFWDRTNKGLFFLILALSFWLVGKKAEQFRNKNIQAPKNQ